MAENEKGRPFSLGRNFNLHVQGSMMDPMESLNFTSHTSTHVFTDLTLGLVQDSGW